MTDADRPARREKEEKEGPIVTLDGPAGSGKSTTAREVARRLGFRHLDSGAFYRALTFVLLERGIAPERWGTLGVADLDAIPLRVDATAEAFRVLLGNHVLGDELRTPRVTEQVAQVARLAPVRAWLLRIQRDAGRRGRLVADGRDMGSVVFPNAELKFFLSADLGERARRRLRDQGVVAPTDVELEAEAALIAERDRRDSEREHSPLRRPEGSIDIDTTRMSFSAQVEEIVRRVEDACAPSRRQVDHPSTSV